MRRFAALYRALDATRKTKAKEAALVDYFATAAPGDAAWALYYLLGRKGRRAVPSGLLRAWTAEASGYPEWLVEESYDAVGDLAETISLLVPGAEEPADVSITAALSVARPLTSPADSPVPVRHRLCRAAERPQGHSERLYSGFRHSLAELVTERVLGLAALDDAARKQVVLETLASLGQLERMLYAKLITGGFRVGVSRGLVSRALATVAGTDPATMAHRLAGRWQPSAAAFAALLEDANGGGDPLRPYPFFLAHPAPAEIETLGDASSFRAEWKWDGIRAQAVRRGDRHLIWSRGEELVDDGFPEISRAIADLPPGTVLDGELLAWADGRPLGFQALQRRISRKTPSARVQREVPVRLVAYDILEHQGEDVRQRPVEERRAMLEDVVGTLASDAVGVSPLVAAESWDDLAALREESRERGVEGLMLKRAGSAYGVGRTRGDWWKWKVDPYGVDAVLVYAQRGSGRRASLYTDYTFAVWRDGELVPVAKAYSGLSDKEIRRVDNFVRRNITERFGPVRAVVPELVFELAFEGIQRSPRHKSGIALRFPRIARWREDKAPADADSIEVLEALLAAGQGEAP